MGRSLLAESETKGRAGTMYATLQSIRVMFVVPLLGNGYSEMKVESILNVIEYGMAGLAGCL